MSSSKEQLPKSKFELHIYFIENWEAYRSNILAVFLERGQSDGISTIARNGAKFDDQLQVRKVSKVVFKYFESAVGCKN